MAEPVKQFKFSFKPGSGNSDDFRLEARSPEEAISRLWIRRFDVTEIRFVEVWESGRWRRVDDREVRSIVEKLIKSVQEDGEPL